MITGEAWQKLLYSMETSFTDTKGAIICISGAGNDKTLSNNNIFYIGIFMLKVVHGKA
jgi:hypothetical protein